MKHDENRDAWIDTLLRRSLRAEATGPVPSAQFQRETIQKMEERYGMQNGNNKKRLCTTILAAALVVAVPAGAFAAWQLLSPAQVAHEFQDKTLEKAFASDDAVLINQSVQSGGYKITLLGMVSGAACSDYLPSDVDVQEDRLYAAVAIARADGTAMPAADSDEYGKETFLVTPLIQGEIPWHVNIFTMGGGYGEFVQDGVQYRLVECADVAAFADREVWLAVTSDFAISNRTFLYDETTGIVSENPDADGVNVLFRLPLDAADADEAKAQQLLQQWLSNGDGEPDGEQAVTEQAARYAQIVSQGELQEHKLLEQSHDGSWWYFYGDGGQVALSPEEAQTLTDGQVYTDQQILMADTDSWQAVLLGRDDQGRLYGELYELPKTAQEKADGQ